MHDAYLALCKASINIVQFTLIRCKIGNYTFDRAALMRVFNVFQLHPLKRHSLISMQCFVIICVYLLSQFVCAILFYSP